MKALRMSVFLWSLLLLFSAVHLVIGGTTGKIAGTVIDQETGDPMAGANVVIEGSQLGAAADLEGNYTILHVPPGNYSVTVSVMGYKRITFNEVRVRIDQTTRLNVNMEMEAVEGEAVTIVADRNMLREDVSASVVAVSDREVAELPVSDVENVIGLQAGIRGDLQIRGAENDQALLMLDGVTLRDPRNNVPISSVALSSIKEISVERGGFTAEYGQVQSGIINVVTQEGSKSAYTGNISFKYSPPQAKYFGISPYDPESMWMKPFLDDEVCWTGTDNGAWDEYTQKQYPDFSGWNEVSRLLLEDDNPDNDLSPMGCQRLFMWEMRRSAPNDQPDYNIDGGFGGPVPFVSDMLGNLRFFTSYRRERSMLLVPLTRDDYVNYDWTLQLTSDINEAIKVRVSGVIGKEFTHENNWSPGDYYRDTYSVSGLIGDRASNFMSSGMLSLADIGHKSIAAKMTHTLNPKTFYEISLEHIQTDYFTRPGEARDLKEDNEIVSGYFVDEYPFNYNPSEGTTIHLDGLAHACKARDNSKTSSTTLKADVTSQLNFNNLVKAGMEFVYNDLNLDYGTIASLTGGSSYSNRVQMHVFPYRFALYLQDKLETKGFIMNVGLRLDYSNSNTSWWDFDPYDKLFLSSKYNDDLEFEKVKSDPQWQLSPRLGISHPITENSKLYFNYGHFKQLPSYQTLFRVDRASDRRLQNIGDPNLTLAKTVSYELGYDHALFKDYLVQVAAFYNDITNQQDQTQYSSISGSLYNITMANDYADTRGFELTLRKSMGRWWTGFANYTYQVRSSGHFGKDQVYEDPTRQKEYDENTQNNYQEKPIPQPYARVNMTLYTPDDFGPEVLGQKLLGSWMANILVDWQAGYYMTWNPENLPSINNNVQQTDWFNTVLRISKTFDLKSFKIQLLMDINNLFNTRRMSLNNWAKSGDYDEYMKSLHLPKSDAYDNIPGDDRYGTYRDDDVAFQPIEKRGIIDPEVHTGEEGIVYYESETGMYYEYTDNAWVEVESGRMQQILDDKAYVDMPNNTSFTFLDPRQIFFGLRITFDIQ